MGCEENVETEKRTRTTDRRNAFNFTVDIDLDFCVNSVVQSRVCRVLGGVRDLPRSRLSVGDSCRCSLSPNHQQGGGDRHRLSLSLCRRAAHISLSPSSQLHDSARTQVSRKSPSPSDRQRSATLAEPPAPSISDEQPVRRVQPVQAQGRYVLARRSCTGFTPYLGNLEARFCFGFSCPSPQGLSWPDWIAFV